MTIKVGTVVKFIDWTDGVEKIGIVIRQPIEGFYSLVQPSKPCSERCMHVQYVLEVVL